jgi:hypothetical protein
MNNKRQENRALSGPLIFTPPASSFVVVLSDIWLGGTDRVPVAAKNYDRNYLTTRSGESNGDPRSKCCARSAIGTTRNVPN